MPEKTTELLKGLLRGELAAATTYEQALQKASDEPEANKLRRIQRDHHKAATTLQRFIQQQGAETDQNSGIWGSFTKAVESVAQLFGDTAALTALREGEAYGITQYETALKRKDLPSKCKTAIQVTLLPRTRAHLTVLDRLMERNHEK